ADALDPHRTAPRPRSAVKRDVHETTILRPRRRGASLSLTGLIMRRAGSDAMRDRYDIVIAGGGPAGSTAGPILARPGVSGSILARDRPPRHHIGESILPRNMPLLQDLGLEPALRRLVHVPKYGAEFGIGNDRATRSFTFKDGLLPGFPVFNIERAPFDKM